MSSPHSSSITLLGKSIQVNFAAAADDDYHTSSLLNQEENTAIATLANHLDRMVPPEETTSKVLTSKKRPFNEEESENDMHDNDNKKKKKKIETKSPPKLMKKFTIYKNKAWGSTWKSYFEKHFFEKMELKMKKKRSVLQITKKPLAEKYKEKVISMGGSEPVLVIEKVIYDSDLKRQSNRLSIPFRQIISKDFLKEEEKVALKKRKEFWVSLIDPCCREWRLTMRQWNMNSDVYVLNSEYYQDLVNTNNLQPGMMVQLWSFRVGNRLCFVLVKLLH